VCVCVSMFAQSRFSYEGLSRTSEYRLYSSRHSPSSEAVLLTVVRNHSCIRQMYSKALHCYCHINLYCISDKAYVPLQIYYSSSYEFFSIEFFINTTTIYCESSADIISNWIHYPYNSYRHVQSYTQGPKECMQISTKNISA
jgi:hypothetical protein